MKESKKKNYRNAMYQFSFEGLPVAVKERKPPVKSGKTKYYLVIKGSYKYVSGLFPSMKHENIFYFDTFNNSDVPEESKDKVYYIKLNTLEYKIRGRKEKILPAYKRHKERLLRLAEQN